MSRSQPPARVALRWATLSLLIFSSLSTSCIGVSAKRVGPGVSVQRCHAVKPAVDGSIDDFEDGNKQLTKLGGRGGYWFNAADKLGSTIDLQLDEPGAGGSEMAAHVTGTTVPGNPESGAWGAQLGVKFLNQGVLYDASKYAGISFRAKIGSGSARNVRFKIGDGNTHPDAGVCKNCWNHFGKDLTLTPEWKQYTVTFSGAEQEPGWGDPRPASIESDKLVSMDWSIGPGLTYDMWFDDITFLECE